ncbi:MAG: galactokinase [Chloroflexota bacterium]|jgi:galactokinase
MIDAARIHAKFVSRFNSAPTLIVRAPGRVNLIGEHTDYNDGFVLPAAIDRATFIAASPRTDKRVRVLAADLNEEDEFGIDQIERSGMRPWSNYIRGMIKSLLAAGHVINGADMVVASSVPRGAGLSSSAALEVATGYVFQLFHNLNILGEELALMAQATENHFVGVNCGIMDQFIVTLGQANHALLIDCRDLNYQAVPLPTGVSVVICDSHIERTLAGSAYNQRRAECDQAVEILKQSLPGIKALRDVTSAQLQEHGHLLSPVVRQRARHVISENERVIAGVSTLQAGNVAEFGRLMNASHASLRDDYAVSIPEMDALVAAAQRVSGCYGSRLTGAGFGGCTVSLVANDAVERFRHEVAAAYLANTGRSATIYVTQAADGVSRVRPE